MFAHDQELMLRKIRQYEKSGSSINLGETQSCAQLLSRNRREEASFAV